MIPRRAHRSTPGLAALSLAGVCLAGLAALVPGAGRAATSSGSGVLTVAMPAASASNPDNPLAGRSWGVYQGNADPAYQSYANATGDKKQTLATIVLTPKAKFFGAWIPDSDIAKRVEQYVAGSTGGDPDVLVQMTLFRMVPWENDACHRLPTDAEQASYKKYVNIVARTLGDQHTAIVLQPDGPFLRCVPGGSPIPAHLIRYAAKRLSQQPNVSVYVEMGSADWFRDQPADAVKMLRAAGVRFARGFALDTSHFDSVARQVAFGHKIVDALAAKGITDRHFVVDTSDNGHPFTGAWYHAHHPDKPLGYAAACRRADQRHCVSLGIPPTTDVSDPALGLSPRRAAVADQLVDGYLWVSRPWLHHQSGDFSMKRALLEVRTSPFQ